MEYPGQRMKIEQPQGESLRKYKTLRKKRRLQKLPESMKGSSYVQDENVFSTTLETKR